MFPAIAGIASEIQKISKADSMAGLGAYYAGLWEHDIHMGLLWSTATIKDDNGVKDVKEYIAPSWSWASTTPKNELNWLQRIIYPRQRHEETFFPVAKVEGLKATTNLCDSGNTVSIPSEFSAIPMQLVTTLKVSAPYLPVR